MFRGTPCINKDTNMSKGLNYIYIEMHFRLVVLSDNLYLRGDHIRIYVLRILLEIRGKQARATIRQGEGENPPLL